MSGAEERFTGVAALSAAPRPGLVDSAAAEGRIGIVQRFGIGSPSLDANQAAAAEAFARVENPENERAVEPQLTLVQAQPTHERGVLL